MARHAVHILVFQAGFDGMVVAIRLRIADDIHRVAVRPVRRQMLVQIFDRCFRQVGHDQSQIGGAVGRHHGGASAIGDDGQPVADGAESARQGSGSSEQLRDVIYAHHTDTTDGGIEHVIRTHQ